ncbi:hypothetical protein BC332_14009 [Capsicum chinense]|nr:hypothetical protein BC332_14009 [Capsicum chinense]
MRSLSRIDLEPNSISKASSRGEDYPSPYKQTTSPFPNQCETFIHSNTPLTSRPNWHWRVDWKPKTGIDLTLISCQAMDLGPKSTSKASSYQIHPNPTLGEEVRAFLESSMPTRQSLHRGGGRFHNFPRLGSVAVRIAMRRPPRRGGGQIDERNNNDGLQDARKELVNDLKKLPIAGSIGVKRMGELDNKLFYEATNRNYNELEADEKAIEVMLIVGGIPRDHGCHPIKVDMVNEKPKNVIDDEDEKLKDLKNNYGTEVYIAVTAALTEINNHNSSG